MSWEVLGSPRGPGRCFESWDVHGVLGDKGAALSPGRSLRSWEVLGVLRGPWGPQRSLGFWGPGRYLGSWEVLGVLGGSWGPGKCIESWEIHAKITLRVSVQIDIVNT